MDRMMMKGEYSCKDDAVQEKTDEGKSCLQFFHLDYFFITVK